MARMVGGQQRHPPRHHREPVADVRGVRQRARPAGQRRGDLPRRPRGHDQGRVARRRQGDRRDVDPQGHRPAGGDHRRHPTEVRGGRALHLPGRAGGLPPGWTHHRPRRPPQDPDRADVGAAVVRRAVRGPRRPRRGCARPRARHRARRAGHRPRGPRSRAPQAARERRRPVGHAGRAHRGVRPARHQPHGAHPHHRRGAGQHRKLLRQPRADHGSPRGQPERPRPAPARGARVRAAGERAARGLARRPRAARSPAPGSSSTPSATPSASPSCCASSTWQRRPTPPSTPR